MPPTCDGTLQLTWEEDFRGRQADRTDIICPGQGAGQFYQRHIRSIVGFDVTWRNHYAPHTMDWLVRVDVIEEKSTGVDCVLAHVVWTERRQSVEE